MSLKNVLTKAAIYRIGSFAVTFPILLHYMGGNLSLANESNIMVTLASTA